MIVCRAAVHRVTLAALVAGLAGCGGGGKEPEPEVAAPTRTVGGAVSGLVGSGLALRNNASDVLAVASNGTFTFAARVAQGAGYSVAVDAQPSGPAQTCSVAGGAGTVGATNVTDVAVTCAAPPGHAVRVDVTNLQGGGLVLQLDGGQDMGVLPGGVGASFPVPVAFGAAYAVTVATQPTFPAQICSVVDGTGVMGEWDVSVFVTCADPPTFAVGGSVSGLLSAGLVLRNTRASSYEDLWFPGDGVFSFPTGLADLESYAVDVVAQPTNPPQVCSVLSGTGTVAGLDVGSVAVTCAPPVIYAVGGTVMGLVGSGLVLATPGAPALAVASDGGFTFAMLFPDQTAYDVTIAQQPASPAQVCVVVGGAGQIAGASATGVVVACSPPTFTVGGAVSGLTGTGLVLGWSLGSFAVTADGSFTFPSALPDGTPFAVAVLTQPTGQVCSVTGANGFVQGANVTTVAVTCTSATFVVGGTVTGLKGTGLVLRNGGADPLAIVENAKFGFAVRSFTGTPYAVTVAVQPVNPAQVCTVANGTGVVGSENVTTVAVTCAEATFAVGGEVKGLAGTGLRIALNGGDVLAVSANGPFTFPGRLADGAAFLVTVWGAPTAPRQTCVVTGGEGKISGSDVTGVQVACDTNRYSVSGTVGGLTGTGLVLLNGGQDPLPIAANGAFTFPAKVDDLAPYAVTVQTQPTGPVQVCTVGHGAGTIEGDVTNVTVTCATTQYTVSGAVTGLVGKGLMVRMNGATLGYVFDADGPFTFVGLADGSPYDVSIGAIPVDPTQICSVSNGKGTVAAADVTNVTVTCTSKVEASAIALGSSQVEIRWAPYGVVPTSYDVWQEGLPPVKIATLPATATSFVHRGRTPSTLYTYRVVALSGGPAVTSAQFTVATRAQATFPSPPSGLTAERSGGDVTLHWDPYGSAERYAVYRTSFPELVGSVQGQVFVGTTTNTQLTDPTGPKIGTHYYQLYAIRTVPAETSPVASLPVTIPAGTQVLGIERPWLDLFRTRGDRTVLHLYWYGAPGATAHHVYASTNSAVITPSEGSAAPPLDAGTTNVPIVEVELGKYRMDAPLTLFTPGTSVFFRIVAVRGFFSADSEEAVGGIITAPAPAGVGSLEASVRNPTTVRLTWGMAAGASTYNVYRLPDPTTAIAPQYWIGATGALDFTDAGRTPDTAYVYRVTAVAVGGAESPPSDYYAVTTLVSGAPLLLPALQPGPLPFSATLSWIPRNGGTTFRIYGGDGLVIPNDFDTLHSTSAVPVVVVRASTEVLLLSAATGGILPPVGGYQVTEVYPDGTESVRSNVMPLLFF